MQEQQEPSTHSHPTSSDRQLPPPLLIPKIIKKNQKQEMKKKNEINLFLVEGETFRNY
jgi:hypothetical protein